MKYVPQSIYDKYIDELSDRYALRVELSKCGNNKITVIDSGIRQGCQAAIIEDYNKEKSYHYIYPIWLT